MDHARLPLSSLLGALAFALSTAAQDSPQHNRETFEIDGHKAIVYAAAKPGAGKPWVWYAPTLNGGVSLVQRKLYYDSFMQAGIAIAGFDLGEVRGSPACSAKFSRFYDEMVKRGWSDKPILLGQSRGGIMMLAWAVRNPDKLRAFVGIYPVLNLASWPLKNSKAATLADFALQEDELVARLDDLNPINHLQSLLKNKVPIFVVHGDSDVVVPYDDNTRLLKERYEAGGGSITVKLIPGEGHMVSPSFFECRELVDFVLASAAK
jgi:Dipeptidyl aminopeptidases/acylaminoacyl-peptidases